LQGGCAYTMFTHPQSCCWVPFALCFRAAIKHIIVSPATTPVQPVFYLYIACPFIPFGLPQARKVCLSSTPPLKMESSLLPMIDNVRGDKAIVRLDCRMPLPKNWFIVFFFSFFSGPSIPPWASTISLVPDVAVPVKSCVRRAQTPLGAAVHMQRVCCACSIEASTDISPRGIFRRRGTMMSRGFSFSD